MTQTTRVGVLLVHGIGEQCQFEHLEEVVRSTASVLQTDPQLDVHININTSADAAYGANQQTWRAENIATAAIEVRDTNNTLTILEFKELWWADLDEPTNWWSQLRFWGWALSLWTKPQYDPLYFGTAKETMRLPSLKKQNTRISIWNRGYLYIVSFVVFLILPLLSLLSTFLRNILGSEIRPDILVQYLGDVNLYQQDAREGKGPIVDLGNKPRVSIRRRLVKAYVEMSLENYDRWYVLAHSLGTVAAFNGLMEADNALPNYLSQNLWQKWSQQHPTKAKQPLTPEQARKMLPKRPAWLQNDDIIDRQSLFSKFRGFMTYGSPLSKFAVLWPGIVPLNLDESVFVPQFEWLNVFDPTDPVADFTKYFNSANNSSINPKEIPYKAGKVHLLSHTEYFAFNPQRKNPLVKQVAYWLYEGKSFKKPFHPWGWPEPGSAILWFYFSLVVVIWVLVGKLITFVLSHLVPPILPKWVMESVSINFSNPLSYIIACGVIVFVVGIVAKLLRLNENKVI